ncbi:glutathione S-transferase [Fusarium sp. MPI-SDFR-AT-0072]|nr:glutathione S-transferase [Fusarium sp. MPI-SDFR-AT-0072]
MGQSDITLYFLNGSRAIRIAWLLEELGLSYKLIASSRGPNSLAPPEFQDKIPTRRRNSPTIQDGDLVIQESGAIVE